MKLIIDISEEEYKEVLEDTYSGTPFENKIFTIIANGTPYEEEERPQGEWIKDIQGDTICKNCGFECLYNEEGMYSLGRYCHHCGADMRGEEE